MLPRTQQGLERLLMDQLTPWSISKAHSERIVEPGTVVQVLSVEEIRAIAPHQRRFRVVISDGQLSTPALLLVAQSAQRCAQVCQFDVVQLDCCSVHQPTYSLHDRPSLVISQLVVVTNINHQIGQPVRVDQLERVAPRPPQVPAAVRGRLLLNEIRSMQSAALKCHLPDTRKIALGLRCGPGHRPHHHIGHIMQPADRPRLARAWVCDSCHEMHAQQPPHRCAFGCEFSLCESCVESRCFTPGDWMVADDGVEAGLQQLSSIADDASSVRIGEKVVFARGVPAWTKVPVGGNFTLIGTRMVDTTADLADKVRKIAQQDEAIDESGRQMKRLRGTDLDGLSMQQLGALASQVSTAMGRISAQQETLRAQVTDCVVCLTDPRAVAFQCGHHCCCADCAETLDKCPMCKAVITQRLRVYSS